MIFKYMKIPLWTPKQYYKQELFVSLLPFKYVKIILWTPKKYYKQELFVPSMTFKYMKILKLFGIQNMIE